MENRDFELNKADLISETNSLHGHIRHYLRYNENIFDQANYLHQSEHYIKENPKGVTINFPFCVMTPENERYPVNRRYRVIIFYPEEATHSNNSPILEPGEEATDFITITINYTKGSFEDAKTQAVAFIDSKVAEVHANYKTYPDLQPTFGPFENVEEMNEFLDSIEDLLEDE